MSGRQLETELRIIEGLHWRLEHLEIFWCDLGCLGAFHVAEGGIQFLVSWRLGWSELSLFRWFVYVLRFRHGCTEGVGRFPDERRFILIVDLRIAVKGSSREHNWLLNWPDCPSWCWFRSRKKRRVSYELFDAVKQVVIKRQASLRLFYSGIDLGLTSGLDALESHIQGDNKNPAQIAQGDSC